MSNLSCTNIKIRPRNNTTILSCQDMTIGYEDLEVLSHLTLDIKEGDYISILGENGSGKSTLVKTIL